MTDLIDPADPDIASFGGDIGPFFLAAAGEVVRSYCGWVIAPPETVTDLAVPVGSWGTIMLPSRYVTQVTSLTVDDQVVEPADYDVDRRGWIDLKRHWLARHECHAVVSFVHGYDSCPLDVKCVTLELGSTATATPAGRATEVAAPSYRILFEQDSAGTTLSPGQRNRLGPYRLCGIK